MTIGVLVRSVGRGLLLVGIVVGARPSRRARRDGGRVSYDGLCVGMGATCLVFVYLLMSRWARRIVTL